VAKDSDLQVSSHGTPPLNKEYPRMQDIQAAPRQIGTHRKYPHIWEYKGVRYPFALESKNPRLVDGNIVESMLQKAMQNDPDNNILKKCNYKDLRVILRLDRVMVDSHDYQI
jgi:hypothetical protein